MTSREEIERLLQMTGRTLEGLPALYSSPEAEAAITVAGDTRIQIGNMLLHQSDVIELLVGALRDALDKPKQKPLTFKEARCAEHVYLEELDKKEMVSCLVDFSTRDFIGFVNCHGAHIVNVYEYYGIRWRCWASRPADEEREAAAWVS